jgi:hypothetical protein
VEATAFITGGWLEAPGKLLPLALQPVRPVGRMQRIAAARRIIVEDEVI